MVLASKFFTAFKRTVSNDLIKSYKLMTKAGLITRSGLGLFTWLPLGYRILHKVENIISKFHDKIGFNRCIVPILHPAEIWHESGRYEAYGAETMRLQDRHGKDFILGPTAEEMFVDAVRQHTTSYKELPINLYNIQWKFRDEIRPRFGVMRSREFLMCDGYSFHLNKVEAEEFYQQALQGYLEMFTELGFDCEPILQTDTGEIGGDMSHEFFTKTHEAMELGHIFLFGTKYTESMKCALDYKSEKLYPYMGSYGVGVSRLIASYAELFGDESSIKWPKSVAPFKVTIIGSQDPESIEICNTIHNVWPDEIYYQDTNISFGEKQMIAEIISSPYLIIAGKKEVNNQHVMFNGEKLGFEEAILKLSKIRVL